MKKTNKILMGAILIITLFMCIGYAEMSGIALSILGEVDVTVQEGVFISSIVYDSDVDAIVENSQIGHYSGTTMNNIIELSSTNANSSITYKVTLFNNSLSTYQLYDITYDDTFYDNLNIIYELSGFTLGDKITSQSSKDIYITFKYKDGIPTKTTLNAYLKFDFELNVKQYTVNFDANEGNVDTSSKIVDYYSTYGELPTPTRKGHTFNGWYTDKTDGTLITSEDIVQITEDQTLYAQWNLAQYTITFDPNGGKVTNGSKIVEYNGTYGELPVPTRTGYTFNGWYTNKTDGTQITSEDIVQITEDQTLYAQWIPKQYTITFDANGGSCDINNKIVNYGTPYGELPLATKTGYKFEGWYTTKNDGVKITDSSIVEITEEQLLYAHWELLPIAINDVPTITMTQDDAKAYYGQIVDNINGTEFNPNSNDLRTWRVFYIDTENKYGDGKGTIYLKADEDSSQTMRFSTTYDSSNTSGYSSKFDTLSNTRYYKISGDDVVNSSGTVINTLYLKLNPTYAIGRKKISSTNFYENEKAAAYLCDKTQFSNYADIRTNYAIGSPTVELWIDSWNSIYGSNYMMHYQYNVNVDGTTGAQKLPGYQLKINNGSWEQALGVDGEIDINAVDKSGLFQTDVGLWFSSPSIVYQGGSLIRLSPNGFIGNATINTNYAYSPVVSLNNDCFVYTESYIQ